MRNFSKLCLILISLLFITSCGSDAPQVMTIEQLVEAAEKMPVGEDKFREPSEYDGLNVQVVGTIETIVDTTRKFMIKLYSQKSDHSLLCVFDDARGFSYGDGEVLTIKGEFVSSYGAELVNSVVVEE